MILILDGTRLYKPPFSQPVHFHVDSCLPNTHTHYGRLNIALNYTLAKMFTGINIVYARFFAHTRRTNTVYVWENNAE